VRRSQAAVTRASASARGALCLRPGSVPDPEVPAPSTRTRTQAGALGSRAVPGQRRLPVRAPAGMRSGRKLRALPSGFRISQRGDARPRTGPVPRKPVRLGFPARLARSLEGNPPDRSRSEAACDTRTPCCSSTTR
jgi:hypothetical protein